MKKMFKSIVIRRRAQRVSGAARNSFDAAVWGCETLSRINNQLCFAIRPVGAFGGPEITLMKRPDVVTINETSHCVIVKDGYYYELNKRK